MIARLSNLPTKPLGTTVALSANRNQTPLNRSKSMGFLDKIKSATSALTGGGAEVFVDLNNAERGMATPISIRGVAKADLKISSVYLLVRATEHASVEDRDQNEDGQTETEIVTGRHLSYEARVEIAGSQEMSQGEEYNWEGEIMLPATTNPSIRGKMVRHTWEIQAGLDAFGNDPDSGWREIEVR
jgi:hypothetical protein